MALTQERRQQGLGMGLVVWTHVYRMKPLVTLTLLRVVPKEYVQVASLCHPSQLRLWT